ncbi:MAG: replicative DNA helicase [Exilispira sp.]|jgi:replicative DNA helicase|nr:replicative DNA helicase [Exilispira sp.]
MINISKIPPQSLEAEKATLGCLLLNSELLETSWVLSEDDFSIPAHRFIYRAIQNLIQKNQPVDILTVVEQLKVDDQIEKVGGATYISQLPELVPTTANYSSYVSIVREFALRRKLIEVANNIIGQSYDSNIEIKEIIDKVEQEILKVTAFDYKENFLILKDIILEILNDLEMRKKTDTIYSGIPTGYHYLDEITSGFDKGDLIVIAARPSMGKTTFALNLALNMAMDYNKTVGFFSLEMSAKMLGYKIISRIAQIPVNDIRRGNIPISNIQKLVDAVSLIFEKKIIFDEAESVTIFDIKQSARRLKTKYGLDVIFVDYLQLISPPAGTKIENRVQIVSDISKGLKQLARELGIPVIACAQLSRAPEKRENKRPQLSDLRESGSIEQDADFVGFLYREDYYKTKEESKDNDQRGVTEFIIGKQRLGRRGDIIKFNFIEEYSLFKELENQDL